MPENASVAMIEDDPEWQGFIRYRVEKEGHKIVAIYSSMAQATQAIPAFEAMGVNVVTLDENLTKTDKSGRNGEQLLQMIREQVPGVKVVSVAAFPRKEADATVEKDDLDMFRQLGKIITRI